MESFESLIAATAQQLVSSLSGLHGLTAHNGEVRREQVAQRLGVNTTQLICAIGFNFAVNHSRKLARFLGYASPENLAAERNYLFIHDRYSKLSVDDALEIYAALGRRSAPGDEWVDLVISRLNFIESQLEETINPVLVGGYKLEVRAIYENGIGSSAIVTTRLASDYALVRNIADEGMIMLETRAVSPDDFLRHPGVTEDEKSRAVFQKLIDPHLVRQYLDAHPGENREGKLVAALASLG